MLHRNSALADEGWGVDLNSRARSEAVAVAASGSRRALECVIGFPTPHRATRSAVQRSRYL